MKPNTFIVCIKRIKNESENILQNRSNLRKTLLFLTFSIKV